MKRENLHVLIMKLKKKQGIFLKIGFFLSATNQVPFLFYK